VVAEDPGEELADALEQLAAATTYAGHLEQALVSNRRIGMAMGILMERHRITEERAFDRLREMSQRRNMKLRELAEQVIDTGSGESRRD
jgi:AmiR/NasT family two-component response regulator